MTKKFWQDWQKLANMTESIILFCKRNDGTIWPDSGCKISGTIQSVSFNGNFVEIRHRVCWPTSIGCHCENRTTTVHRKDIRTVIFKNIKTKTKLGSFYSIL